MQKSSLPPTPPHSKKVQFTHLLIFYPTKLLIREYLPANKLNLNNIGTSTQVEGNHMRTLTGQRYSGISDHLRSGI